MNWILFHVDMELKSPQSWLETEKRTTDSGTLVGLDHVQSMWLFIPQTGRTSTQSFDLIKEPRDTFRNAPGHTFILVLSQVKEIGRWEALMQRLVLTFLSTYQIYWAMFPALSVPLKKNCSLTFPVFLPIQRVFLFIINNTQNLSFFIFTLFYGKNYLLESCPCFLL